MKLEKFLDELNEEDQSFFDKLVSKTRSKDPNRGEISKELKTFFKRSAESSGIEINVNALVGTFWKKYGIQKEHKPNKQEEALTEDRFSELPGPLYTILQHYTNEDVYFRKVHRLIDCFEWAMKWHTVLTVSDLFRVSDFPDQLKMILSSGLRTPSLGTWNKFFRESLIANEQPMVPWNKWERLIALEKTHNIVNFRNTYGHGATPDELDCKKDCERFYPILLQLIGSKLFTDLDLLISTQNGVLRLKGANRNSIDIELSQGHAAVIIDNLILDIWPLGACSQNPKEKTGWFFYYFNALKSKKIEQLNYEKSLIVRDPQLWEPFHEHFPLDEWRTPSSEDQFQDIIERNTEDFIGRKEEIDEVHTWIQSKTYGFSVFLGSPGIGKTAFLAMLSKQTFTNIDIIPYFIVRKDVTTSPKEFLKTLLQKIAVKYNLRFNTLGTEEELLKELKSQLRVVSQLLTKSKNKLLLIIDGLDEALSSESKFSEGSNVIKYIPRSLPANTFILMAGRPRSEVKNLYNELDREHRVLKELDGLTQSDIRGILYHAVSKYELTSEYVEKIREQSEGNPLYVKLLMEELIEGRKTVNEIDTLPANLGKIYSDILKRLRKLDPQYVNILMIFALAREKLTAEQLAGINSLDVVSAVTCIEGCMEVITEGRNSEGQAIYFSFHDSFSDFMKTHKDYRSLIPKVHKQYINFVVCYNSKKPSDKMAKMIKALVDNTEIEAEQFTTLSNIIDLSSQMLTSYKIIQDALMSRPIEKMLPVYEKLVTIQNPATAKIVIECLINASKNSPEKVMPFLKNIVHEVKESKETDDAQSQLQSVRIVLDVAVALVDNKNMQDDVKTVLLNACWYKNENIRTLGVVSVFRVTSINYAVGMDIVQKLADKVVCCKVIRPSRVEPFVGCALGLFFEKADDKRLCSDLNKICGGIIKKIIGVKFAMWLLTPLVSYFLAKIPDDYNAVNLGEIKSFKTHSKKHLDFVTKAEKLIDYIDPQYGTHSEVKKLFASLPPEKIPFEINMVINLCTQSVILSRSLAGQSEFLDLAYDYWNQAKDTDTIINQDFIFELRTYQTALRLRGLPPIDDIWIERYEEAVKHYFYRRKTRYHCQQEYICGSICVAFLFIARHTGKPETPLLKEFIEFACKPGSKNETIEETSRNKQLDAILLRAMEIGAIEYGTFDPSARGVSFYGLNCFLQHIHSLDDYLMDKIANLISRMKVYFSSEVDLFLAELNKDARDMILVRMNRMLPEENIGTLISMRTELLFAYVMSEPPDQVDGLRNEWMDFLKRLVSQESLSKTLRYMGNKVVDILT